MEVEQLEEFFWGYIFFSIKSSLLPGFVDQVEFQSSKGCTTTINVGVQREK